MLCVVLCLFDTYIAGECCDGDVECVCVCVLCVCCCGWLLCR